MIITVTTFITALLFDMSGNGIGDAGSTARSLSPSFRGATGWMNTQPLSLKDLRGKVVLIDFWTYTCINWRRTLPYVREWASKYKDKGLVVVGVHTPEFSFEKKLENVRIAVDEMKIDYPVALDNNYEIWNSFQNNYWPAIYLIDIRGRIRYQKFGEESYQEIEGQLQQLLKEASAQGISDSPLVLQPQGVEAGADWENLRSPETYLNYNQGTGFVSPEKIRPGMAVNFSVPAQLNLNQWALSGEWVIGQENIRLQKAQGKITFRFHARDLHMVMGPVKPVTSVKFRVLIDGNPPDTANGQDIDSKGNGIIKEQRMYHLVRQSGPIVDRIFEIEFSDPQVELYVFTFG